MQIELHFSGRSEQKSFSKECSMDDILSAVRSLFDISSEQELDVNLVNKEGDLCCFKDPSQQLFDGATIDIRVAVQVNAAPNKENDSSNTNINEEQNANTSTFSVSIDNETNNEDENNDDANENEQKEDEKAANHVKVPRFVARLRGLPWSARESDISEFFSDEDVKEVQIVYLTDGRASGEALVEFANVKSFESAFLRNRKHIGHRYIEIFKSTPDDIDIAAGRLLSKKIQPPKTNYVIRMRGLPYSATETDIYDFFQIPRPTNVHLVKDDLGRPSGEGFSEFKSEVDAIAAMAKHRHHMSNRYIELFRSSADELMRALGLTEKFAPSPRKTSFRQPQHPSNDYFKSQQQHQPIKSTCLLMRGLPYSCTESDITKFFQEIDITPIRIHRKADGAEAYVEFYSISDTDVAMSRHRSYIGRRYIELFRVTYDDMARTVGLPISSTNIPASALNLNSALMSLSPVYAFSAQQRKPPQRRSHHMDAYKQQSQQMQPSFSTSHRHPYQSMQPSQAPPNSASHQQQSLLLNAANINVNQAAMVSPHNGNGLQFHPQQQAKKRQQQHHFYQGQFQ